MRVKRYVVDTMPDAMYKIRSELGSDAVILSTKEMKIGGFIGLFRKKKIEVIAASDSNDFSQPIATQVNQSKPVNATAQAARSTAPDAYNKFSELLNKQMVEVASGVEPIEQQKHIRAVDEIQPVANLQRAEDIKSSLPSASTALQRDDRLLDEIKQMKSMMNLLTNQQREDNHLPDRLQHLQNVLLQRDVSPELVERWIDAAYQHWSESQTEMDEKEMDILVRREISTFLSTRIDEGISEHTRIVYVAGPTGVGKTTTIAKLAAEQIFRKSKKVGLITADTYRISAVEQLRTYASILNVPLEVVQSPGDMFRALQRLEHCNLIIMDTAGRNYLNEIFVAELHSLLSSEQQSEMYLVLSLTSKSNDMKRITEHFSKYGLDKVIFTKLDETGSSGPLFNLLDEYPLKVSYLTNGQNVPDDLLKAKPDLLIDLLLEEGKP